MLLRSQPRFPYDSAKRFCRVRPVGEGKGEQPTFHASHHHGFQRKKEKPLTLPPVREVHRAWLSLSPIAKGPQVKEVSYKGKVCKPAPLGTWHDSVVGEKKSQQGLALSSRNQVLACGPAERCKGAWSRSGTERLQSPRSPFAFLSRKGFVTFIPLPS